MEFETKTEISANDSLNNPNFGAVSWSKITLSMSMEKR